MHVVHLQRTWPLLSQGTTDGALQSLARSPAIFFANASEITRCTFRSMSISLAGSPALAFVPCNGIILVQHVLFDVSGLCSLCVQRVRPLPLQFSTAGSLVNRFAAFAMASSRYDPARILAAHLRQLDWISMHERYNVIRRSCVFDVIACAHRSFLQVYVSLSWSAIVGKQACRTGRIPPQPTRSARCSARTSYLMGR